MVSQEIDIDLGYRSTPIIHTPVDFPVCLECESKDKEVLTFNPDCKRCISFINKHATIGETFTILRQWVPSVQQAVGIVVCQMLDNGAHMDDRDGLTDMTMLHFAVKSGTKGMGNVEESCRIVSLLLSRGADPYIRCRWTNMAAIHYATYFDVSQVLEILLNATKDVDVDSLCCEFDNGSPLHISCRTLAFESAKVLLTHGADKSIKDSNGKTPSDWLPDLSLVRVDREMYQIVSEMRFLIEKSSLIPSSVNTYFSHTPKEQLQVSNALKSLGIKIGDKVFVGGIKTGILRYCGPTLFANGVWAGIELDEAVGKNNGSISSIQYFKCPPYYGIFAPLSKITKQPTLLHILHGVSATQSRMDLTHITAKINSGLRQSKQELNHFGDKIVEVGDRVMVAGKRIGVIKYVGDTRFAPGCWYGIEFSKAVGKNDGSVDGFRYFNCPPNHGIFAPPSRVQRMEKDQLSRIDKCNLSRNSNKFISETGIDDGVIKQSAVKFRNFNTITKCSSTTSSTEPILAEGTHVFCSGEIGVVQYMGPVSFAEGIWLGVELRTPSGKHDGAVQGRRYFTCRPGHGLLVRPSKVYVRGINGSKLIAAN